MSADVYQVPAELQYPDLLVDGELPEERVIYCGLTWERYLAIDRAFGEDRSGPRLFYFKNQLEMVRASREHERLKAMVTFFLEEHCCREDISHTHRGGATMQMEGIAVAEPVCSWCISEEKKSPDIAFEIILSEGGIPKLDVYQKFGIPEVWIWQDRALSFHLLREDGSGHERSNTSRLLPGLDLPLLYRCVGMKDWLTARRVIRAGLGT